MVAGVGLEKKDYNIKLIIIEVKSKKNEAKREPKAEKEVPPREVLGNVR